MGARDLVEEPDAQDLVERLVKKGLTAQDISDALQGRVSRRTVYRWLRGDTLPQRKVDMQALRDLVAEKEA